MGSKEPGVCGGFPETTGLILPLIGMRVGRRPGPTTRGRRFGQGGFPVERHLRETFHDAGMVRGHVIRFGPVFCHVVEFNATLIVGHHQFPIAVAHAQPGPVRSIAITTPLPK